MGQRRRFTPEFKRQAVQLPTAGQRPAPRLPMNSASPAVVTEKSGLDKRGGSLFLDRTATISVDVPPCPVFLAGKWVDRPTIS